MAKKKPVKAERAAYPSEIRREKKRSAPGNGGWRETVESVAIAFALAFLFKTFQAEAYVIPTGSMAPTLLGRHKDVQCPSCGIEFMVGASTEVDENTGWLIPVDRVRESECPNCRLPMQIENHAAFNGDRIVVNKLVSEFNRFDVVVFKNPEEGHVNYIKRLVGLPGETIRIRQGNLWARTDEDDRWTILRKDDVAVQKDTQLPVYDDQFAGRDLLAAGWPERWVPNGMSPDRDFPAAWEESPNAWIADRDKRSFTADTLEDTRTHWLRYRHFVASSADWHAVLEQRDFPGDPQPSLISDYCGYNVAASSRAHSFNADAYWVGDLTVNYTLQVHTAGEFATVKFALLEGPDTMLCEIRLTDGTAKLTRINRRTDRDGDHPQTVASGKTPVRGRGTWRIAFANVDNRLLLWVNDESVDFDGSTNIDQNFVDALATLPEPTDVAPCGIAVQGVNATVSELLLERDIYYRNDAMVPQEPTTYRQNPYDVWTPEAPRTQTHEEVASPSGLHRDLAYSNHWAEHYASAASLAHDKYGSYTEYCLADDEYLMLGDNSPRSKDSRLFDWYNRPKWDIRGNRCAVKEKDLIGRALFVFWPHGVPFLNDGKGFTLRKHRYYDGSEVKEVHDYPLHRIPFYPNVSRMKKIR